MRLEDMKTTSIERGPQRTLAAGKRLVPGRPHIRPFRYTAEEYEAIVAIDSANTPDMAYSTEEFRRNDETWKEGCLRERLVAEQDGRIVGFATYAQVFWIEGDGLYFFGLRVHPRWQAGDAADRLLDSVEQALAAYEPRKLATEYREDLRYITELLAARGYAAVMRYPLSVLDVQRFDPQPFLPVCDRVKASGIRIDDLASIAAEDSDWQRKIWQLNNTIMIDVPSPEPFKPQDLEYWQERVLGSPNFLPQGWIVARDGQRFVGMSALFSSQANTRKLYTGLTGVLPSHRRRGIATAMKVYGILYAQRHGIEEIETDNEENNPMLDINRQLGFSERPALVSYEKEIEVKDQKKAIIEPPQ